MGEALEQAHEIIVAIRRIVRGIALHSRRLAQTSGLTVPQLLVLRALSEHAEGTTASAIQPHLGVSPGTLSGLVQRLVQAGLVDRSRDEADRRRVLLTLTDAGHEVLGAAPATLQDTVLDRLERLDATERDDLLRALHTVVALMDVEAVDASPVLAPGDALSG